MRRSWCCLFAACSLFLLTGIVAANDSGPGPTNGAASKQYNVIILRASGFEQGTFSFQGSTDTSTGTNTDGNEIDEGTPTNPDTGAGNDPDANTTNPTATGDFGPISSTGGMNNTTGTTTTGTTTTGTTTGTPTATTTSPPASYWTRARVNGQVDSQTSDSSSPNYWTRARANGEVVAGDTSGNGGGGGEESAVASGTMTSDFGEQSSTGNWYSLDLGGFSLWYASTSSAGSSTGSVNIVGYATPEIIVGRTSSGTGGFIETMFNGSFFVGQATDASTDGEIAESE
jgi:hypothetical protein